MSIQFGVYDFFAYAMPGGLYLLSFIYIYASFVGIKFDLLSNLSIVQILIVTVFGYIFGLVIDRIAIFWYRIFEPKQLAEVVFEKLKEDYPNLEFNFRGKDWAVLIAYLQREKIETTSEIHRFNAIHIMMKNASFNFIILAVAEIILFFNNGFDLLYLIIGVSLIIASIISARQAVRFNKWFFKSNFEAVIAKGLEQKDLITKRVEHGSLIQSKIAPKKQGGSKK